MLLTIAKELQQVKTYKWGKKQDDSWDHKTNFIYSTKTYNELKERCLKDFPANIKLMEYAKTRWYNYHTHNVVLDLFLQSDICRIEKNLKNKDIDLYIKNIPFDLKLSVYPKSLAGRNLSKQKLIEWLYSNQSKQGRNRLQNRIFILVLDNDNKHRSWAVKRDFELIKEKIDIFLDNTSFIPYNTTKSNVIVVTKN